ncbi:hypothetical protein SP90_00990 [Halodesulfovibrio spirochaetisodalis]|uniref:DUF4331 domain-containing protein n=2 Tax=Halodesulfovibrio spirochaetisodalis TaxID=1560234 RepID=A0A1B7XQ46_9BACT|nr:hypothetical protein SP90_00990 [Halodesulfovibrio spirochaetisodalis]
MKYKIPILTIIFLLMSFPAHSAHHFQTDLVSHYPEYNIGDVFVFNTPDMKSTVFILTANPSKPGKGGPSANLTAKTDFGSGGLYNIHIASDKDIKTGVTYTFIFDGDKIRVGKIDNPNAKIGDKGKTLADAQVGQKFELNGEIKVWTGRILEPYFVDAFDFGVLQNSITMGTLDKNAFKKTAKDIFTNARISAIVMEIPNTMLSPEVYYYGTTAVMDHHHGNEWVQVNRMGNVLMPYIFLWDSPATRLEHDQHRPDGDDRHKNTISNNVYRAASVSGGQKNVTEYANTVAEQLTPDVLMYKIGTKAKYGIGSSGGRPLDDDPSDVVFSTYLGIPMSDGIPNPKHYTESFPYVIPVDRQK